MMHKSRFAVKKYQFLLTGAIFSKQDHMILTGCVVTHHQMSLPTGSWQTTLYCTWNQSHAHTHTHWIMSMVCKVIMFMESLIRQSVNVFMNDICSNKCFLFYVKLITTTIRTSLGRIPGASPGFGRGGGQNFFFQIWEFACREATCCAWRSHAHC